MAMNTVIHGESTTATITTGSTTKPALEQLKITSGASHVTIKDSLMGPQGASAGEALAINASTGADVTSAAITSNAIDIYIPAAFTGGVRVAIGSAPATASGRVYGPGTYRWPITSGYKLAARSNDATTGTIYINPVA